MKFQKYIEEEYEASIVMGNKQIPIFKNPSKKEMAECGGHIRFVIDFKNKNLYVSNGSRVLHDDMMIEIFDDDYDYPNLDWSDMIWGEAKYVNGKMKFHYSDELERSRPESKRASVFTKWHGKDNWLNHWFGGSILDTIKKWWQTTLNDQDEE